MIRAIETIYSGYRFRSRLEARWAIYFDALGIQYEYEPEGFDLGEAGWYLPDFYLPRVGMWAEVKRVPLTPRERKKAEALSQQSGEPVLMLVGLPDKRSYWACGTGHDYVLAHHHDYYTTENRFFCATGIDEGDTPTEYVLDMFGDFEIRAILKAKQARFEHGERP